MPRTSSPLLLALACALVPDAAVAACSGADATELGIGCEIQAGNEDFHVKLLAPPGTDPSSDAGVRAALYRTVVFVHGYGVDGFELPPMAFEDGSPGVFDRLFDAKVSVLSLSPGRSKADRVEDDAAALRAALELLDGYRTDAASPLVVVGHSMGGLLARIALAGMEADGEAHHVGLYVSYDAPHGGVHVPHGMQSLKVKLDAWAAMTEADFVAIDPGWAGVFDLAALAGMSTTLDPDAISGFPDPTSTQAQQMTIQGIVDPAAHPAFQALLDATGFPEDLRKIAVSNGNTRDVGCTQAVGPGEELFWFSGAKGNSAASVRGTFQVLRDDPGSYSFRSDVYYDGLFQNHDGGRKDATTPDDWITMDDRAGGTLDYAGEMAAAAADAAGDFHEPSWRAASDSAIPFVPTWSALALPPDTRDADLAGIVAGGGTPFDAVYAIGDLPAFPDNLDHNTLVMPDAVLDEIEALLACPQEPAGDPDDDGVDSACDDDDDNDGAFDVADNCADVANVDQADLDADGTGDACDGDPDGDGTDDAVDNCPGLANADQADADGNGVGDACDPFVDGPVGGIRCGCATGGGGGGLAIVALALAARRRRRG